MVNLVSGDGYISINDIIVPVGRSFFPVDGDKMAVRVIDVDDRTNDVLSLNIITGFQKYDQYTIDGAAPADIAALTDWVKTNAFQKKTDGVTQAELDAAISGVTYPKVTSNSGITQGNNTIIVKDQNGNYSPLGFAGSATTDYTLVQRGAGGVVVVGAPTADNHSTTRLYVGNMTNKKSQLLSIAAIADPATATATDVANAFNTLLAALKA